MNAKPIPELWMMGYGPGITGPTAAWKFRLFEHHDEKVRRKAQTESILLSTRSQQFPDSNEVVAIIPICEGGEVKAALIVAAVNACFQINPTNPMAVAEALIDLVDAARLAEEAGNADDQSWRYEKTPNHNHLVLLDMQKYADEKRDSAVSLRRAALAKAETKS